MIYKNKGKINLKDDQISFCNLKDRDKSKSHRKIQIMEGNNRTFSRKMVKLIACLLKLLNLVMILMKKATLVL